MLVIFYAGKIILDLNIQMNWVIIIIMLISGYSLSAIGALIGTRSRDAQQAGILTQIVQPVIVFCAPVFVPKEALPKWLAIISNIIPTKYVAAALRSACIGVVDWLSLLVLFIFCIISIFVVDRAMDWRI